MKKIFYISFIYLFFCLYYYLKKKALEEEILKYKEANEKLEQLQNETMILNQKLIEDKVNIINLLLTYNINFYF